MTRACHYAALAFMMACASCAHYPPPSPREVLDLRVRTLVELIAGSHSSADFSHTVGSPSAVLSEPTTRAAPKEYVVQPNPDDTAEQRSALVTKLTALVGRVEERPAKAQGGGIVLRSGLDSQRGGVVTIAASIRWPASGAVLYYFDFERTPAGFVLRQVRLGGVSEPAGQRDQSRAPG